MERSKFMEIKISGCKCQVKECAPSNGLQFCDMDVSENEK